MKAAEIFRYPLAKLALCGYLLMVGVLVFQLVELENDSGSTLALARVTTHEDDQTRHLLFEGEGFRAGLHGLVAPLIIDEDARLWTKFPKTRLRSLDVENDLSVFATHDNRLVTMQVGKGSANPLGSLALPGMAGALDVAGQEVFVGLVRHAGIVQVDLSNPEHPELVEHFMSTGAVIDLKVAGRVVYFTDLYKGLGVINLASKDPRPEYVQLIESPWTIDVEEDRVAVGTLKGDVFLFQIVEAGRPELVGRFSPGAEIRGLALEQDRMMVTLSDKRVVRYDLHNWPQVAPLCELALPGRPLNLYDVTGTPYVIVSLVGSGMAVLDVRDRETIEMKSHFVLPDTFKDLHVRDGMVFAVGHQGLDLFSLDKILAMDGGSPEFIAREFNELRRWNGHLFGSRDKELIPLSSIPLPAEGEETQPFCVVPDKDGLNFFEMDGDGRVRHAGSFPIIDGANDTVWRDDVLFVINEEELTIFSGSDPSGLQLRSRLRVSKQLREIAIFGGGYLLAATHHSGLVIIDVRDPDAPVQVSTLAAPRHLSAITVAHSVLVLDDTAYIAQGQAGVHLVDVSNPKQPRLKQIVQTPGSAKALAFHDGLLLVATGKEGVCMIDVVSSPVAQMVGAIATPLRSKSILVYGDDLYVTNHPGGMLRLPLPQRMNGLVLVDEQTIVAEGAERGTADRMVAHLYGQGEFAFAPVLEGELTGRTAQ